MRAIFMALTFLMGFLGLPIPDSGAALQPYHVTQAAAQETATCPNGHISGINEYFATYIIVEGDALVALDQAVQATGGVPKPDGIVKVVLIPKGESMVMPMATFDKNDCFLSGGYIPEETTVLFFEELKKLKGQKEAGADAVEE